MDANNLFDALSYFKGMCKKYKLAKAHAFYPCVCSGINSLEEVLQNLRRESAFFAVDDTNDGVTEKRSGGYFKKRTFTVFLMMRYRISDMAERQAALEVCRQLFRQVHSRKLVDRENLDNELVYLNSDNVYSRELGEYFISGCTGLYFMIDVSEPVSLIYDSDEWEE